MSRFKADLLLLLCAFIWGTAFVAQKDLHAAAWPVLFVAARFLLSALLLAPLALFEARKPAAPPVQRPDLLLAVLIGACLCVAATMQQVALTSTTATNGGFLTAAYVALVPFVVWVVAGDRPRPMVLLACAIAVLGAWLLADHGQGKGWSGGDLVLLAADLFWALHITLIAKFLGQLNRPFLLCFVQYGVTALGAGIFSVCTESTVWSEFQAGLVSIAYAGIASGGIAYTLQIVAQRHAPAAEAALILSLESVFAAIAGAVVLHERLTALATVGCLLILAGAVMVDLAPAVHRGLLRVVRGEGKGPRV